MGPHPAERILWLALEALLELVGGAVVKGKVDEWEAARAPSRVAFAEKFPGETPP